MHLILRNELECETDFRRKQNYHKTMMTVENLVPHLNIIIHQYQNAFN